MSTFLVRKTDIWCKAESIYEQIYPSLIPKERIETAWCFSAFIYEQIETFYFQFLIAILLRPPFVDAFN